MTKTVCCGHTEEEDDDRSRVAKEGSKHSFLSLPSSTNAGYIELQKTYKQYLSQVQFRGYSKLDLAL